MRFDASLSSATSYRSRTAHSRSACTLLVQLLLEVGEHLEVLALGGKLSPVSVAYYFC